MNEQPKFEMPSASPQGESEVLALIKKLQQQLVYLEKKIDLLVNQSGGRQPSFKGGNFKPFRRFDSPDHHGKREHGHPGERGFGQGRSFDRPRRDDNRGPHQGERPFFRKRKDRS